MADTTTRIDAPIPIGVRPIPGGSRLLLDAFAQAVIEDVVGALLAPDGGLLDELLALAEMTPEQRNARPEHELPVEEFTARLADMASKWTAVYGERGLDLADAVHENAVESLPIGHAARDVWEQYKRLRDAVNGGAAA